MANLKNNRYDKNIKNMPENNCNHEEFSKDSRLRIEKNIALEKSTIGNSVRTCEKSLL